MERFLFSKIPTWSLFAAVLFGLIGAIGFGMLVYDRYAGPHRFGALSDGAAFLAGAPETTWQAWKRGNPMKAQQADRFEGRSGWEVAPDTRIAGYLLLSRHDGDTGRHAVELVDLTTFETVHRWSPDADVLFADVPRNSDPVTMSRWNARLFRAIHPIATADGGLLVKDHDSPLFRVDACGSLVWKQDAALFHHSTEPDPTGGYWMPGYTDEPVPGIVMSDVFKRDAIVHVAEDGEILESHSLTHVLIDAGFMPQFLTAHSSPFVRDPMHLNDIQPVPGDGPFWQAGDLFLSMRHMSTVLLYRPSTREVLWSSRGPWMAQHDVDIVDDHRIMVFSNNTYDAGRGGYIRSNSDLMLYDFETDSVTRPFAEATEALEMRTVTEGLSDALPGGAIMVEEENSGRILILSRDNDLLAEFVNRAADGAVYRLGWSRVMERASGDALRRVLEQARCE